MGGSGTTDLPTPAAVCDGGDLDCGSGLLLIIRKAMDPLDPGQILEIRSREISVGDDLPAWCRMVGHDFIGGTDEADYTSYLVRKGGEKQAVASLASAAEKPEADLETDLEKARNFQWTVRVRQVEAGRCTMYARSHTMPVGKPIDFGFAGSQTPLSAVEHLISSLGACLAAGYQALASRHGVIIDQLEVALRGELDNPLVYLGLEQEGHPGFSRIGATLYVSADADDQVLEQIWATTLERSPIVNTLNGGQIQLDLRHQIVL